MKAGWIILVATALLSSCQTKTERVIPQNAQSTPPVIADTWQKSKECASQAEKLAAEWHRSSDDRPGKSGVRPFSENHYSPKYNRCFIKYTREINPKDQPGTVFEDTLFDAFERSTLATSLTFGGPESLCSTDDDPHASCAKAASFISEHMKN